MECLHAAGVPADLHDRALELTHGDPLALSLLAPAAAAAGNRLARAGTLTPAPAPGRRRPETLHADAARLGVEGSLR